MKNKTLIVDDLILLYDSHFQKIPGKFRLHWISPLQIKNFS